MNMEDSFGFGPVWCFLLWPLAAASSSSMLFHVLGILESNSNKVTGRTNAVPSGTFFSSPVGTAEIQQLLHTSGRKPTGSKVRIKTLVASKIWNYMSWGFKLVKPRNSHFPAGRKSHPSKWNLCKGLAEVRETKKKSLSVKHVQARQSWFYIRSFKKTSSNIWISTFI